MPVYGDMLSFFPELLREYTIFDMKAQVAKGYGPRENERVVVGVIMNMPFGGLGIEGENRQSSSVLTFWVQEYEANEFTVQGAYIEYEGTVFLLQRDNGFKVEGGFTKFILQSVPVIDGTQKPNPNANQVQNWYE